MIDTLDLFSGIGGISLGLERTGGFRTVGFCEIDPYCQKVLKKHWPNVPLIENARTLTLDTLVNLCYNIPGDQETEGVFEMAAKRKQYDGAVELYASGASIGDCADYYGITRQAMWMILKRRGCQFQSNKRFGNENHFYRGGSRSCDHANNLVEGAIGRGTLVPEPCQVCGSNGLFEDGRREVQAHHDDYNFPLRVRWLCQTHHHGWHKEHQAIPLVEEVMPKEVSDRTIDMVTAGFP